MKDQQKDIDKAVKQIRDSFQIARSYWQARKSGTPGFKSDLRWEALMPVFDGKLPLFVHANTVAQIEAVLAWAKEAQLKIVLVGGQDAWRMASQLKESDTPVIITLSTALPSRRDDGYDSTFGNAAKLHEAGVRFCMAMNGPELGSSARAQPALRSLHGLRLWLAERRSSESGHSLSRAASWDRRSVGIFANRKSRHPHRDQPATRSISPRKSRPPTSMAARSISATARRACATNTKRSIAANDPHGAVPIPMGRNGSFAGKR